MKGGGLPLAMGHRLSDGLQPLELCTVSLRSFIQGGKRSRLLFSVFDPAARFASGLSSRTSAGSCPHHTLPYAFQGFAAAQSTLNTRCNFEKGSLCSVRGQHSLGKDQSEDWEDTLEAISGLITKRHREQIQSDSIEAMQDYLQRLSVDLKPLPVIHVAGTKGKGSTCTMVESILRRQGLRTGLYTSPHLIDVRERIRIDGDPLSRQDFSRWFWDVRQRLGSSAEGARFPCLPGYFRFFTVMALSIFVQEKVDVAVVEVGLGGRLDATNVVHPTVCGVSSLGLDHTQLLGDTIDKIAREKAGIFKPGVLAVSSPQPPEATHVLRLHAQTVGCPLIETIPLSHFRFSTSTTTTASSSSSLSSSSSSTLSSGGVGGEGVEVGIAGSMQAGNAALAVALARGFLALRSPNNKRDSPTLAGKASNTEEESRQSVGPEELFVLPDSFREGLAHAKSLGRCQLVRLLATNSQRRMSVYLDGAHTRESMASCTDWFQQQHLDRRRDARRVLVFYCSPDRDAAALMAPLLALHASLPFHKVVICSNDFPALPPGTDPDTWRRQLAHDWKGGSGMEAEVVADVSALIPWAEREAGAREDERWEVETRRLEPKRQEAELHVLVTGSLLMCGDLLVKLLHRSGGVEAIDAALKFSNKA